jgi:hypothetical protein
MLFHEIAAREIGSIAKKLLAQEQGASVMGVTSRGLFLHLPSEWVVFVSSESYRGPLTLNVRGDLQAWRVLAAGTPVVLEDGNLQVRELGLIIDVGKAHLWQSPPLPGVVLPAEERHARLLSIARLALLGQKNSARSGLLQEWLALLDGGVEAPEMLKLVQAVNSRQLEAIAVALLPLLGLGPGLTPSGDDLAMGFLLTINRWGERLSPGLDASRLNQSILGAAAVKTSTLSANLIYCASQGEADERLVSALDGIMTGVPETSVCVSHLLNWGSNSGCDALAGMALATILCR